MLFISGLGLKSKISGYLSSSYDPEKYSLLLHLPISRVTLLESLIIYQGVHLINCFKSGHHFCWWLSHTLGNTRNNNLVKQVKYK